MPLRLFLRTTIKEIFTLDTRSLAVFRIGLGVMIIYNISTIIPYIDPFFGPSGIHPLLNYYANPNYYWSIHALSDHYMYILGLFVLQVFFALLLIIGHKTRLAILASWILSISMEHRMYEVGFGGDAVMNVCLMWGIFLPLGASFSLDNLKGRTDKMMANQVCSAATVAFIVQVILIYVVAAWQKNHPFWEKDLTAVYFTLKTHEFAKPIGSWLTQFPDVLKVLTLLTLIMERYVVLLLLCPWRHSFFRGLLVVSFVVFHLMIELTMDVGWLPYIMMVMWSALLPSRFWAWMLKEKEVRSVVPVESPQQILMGKAVTIGVSVVLVYIIVFNVFRVNNALSHHKWPYPQFFQYANQFNINQVWTFFIRRPETSTRLYYLEPVLEKPKRGVRVRYDFPQMMADYRWSKLFWNFQKKRFAKFKVLTAQWLVYDWNKKHPHGPKIKGVRICYILEEIVFYGSGRVITEIN